MLHCMLRYLQCCIQYTVLGMYGKVCVSVILIWILGFCYAKGRYSLPRLPFSDRCGSGGPRVPPAVPFMEHDFLVAEDTDTSKNSTISIDFPAFP